MVIKKYQTIKLVKIVFVFVHIRLKDTSSDSASPSSRKISYLDLVLCLVPEEGQGTPEYMIR